MNRELLKEQVKQAKERFNTYTSFENLIFICELLDLESEKYENENQKGIAFDIQHISYKLSKILSEIF